MTELQAVILGVVQGITEFLPISSSGHLVLLQRIWHISSNQMLFVICLHIGTLVAVVAAYHREIRWLIHHPWSWTARMIYAALVPTACAGALFEDWFENVFASGATIGLEFVITGVILWWMDGVTTSRKLEEDMTVWDALCVGCCQAAAILPALSRSGLTIAGGLWRGMDREAASRFSFLLSLPAILGATAVQLEELLETPTKWIRIDWLSLGLGTAAAAMSGYIGVRATLWLVKKARMRIFAVYVWALAAWILFDQVTTHRWFPPLFHG
ncbi:MAG: undecaprenyl-diphosphate phosphatase [Alicyclobacillus herbarius]|uniref:undecaprenyl-diphosphate phosphatase n=1 Tax=Alicyclobacillus herbarius TaxID=122960 RepID=UPI000400583C|nr:undecaprenyl-diphosphate phosphatase [Alicyclobacillus herbarius]MCL6631427.1 undecaprenyl-diphosphate phosphatase [Alicyclobacillus herbarius]